MSNDPFFKLKAPFNIHETQEEFAKLLSEALHIKGVMYKPNALTIKTIENKVFENISFSKTSFIDITIKKCKFINCLFIGSVFDRIRFHDCTFDSCNFFRATFISCYGKPSQFKNAIKEKQYSNIGTHLFNELRLLYKSESQKGYKSEAEFYFNKWKYHVDYSKRNKDNNFLLFYFSKLIRLFYGIFFGYGYRLRNLISTTSIVIITLMVLNYFTGHYLYQEGKIDDFSKTIYFTFTTMFTLGASGFDKPTELGRYVILLNMLLGISLLTFTVSALFNRIIK